MSPTFLSFTISLKVKRTLNFFSILFISCMLVSESHPSTRYKVHISFPSAFSQVLREKQINLLQEIKWICRKHDTDVKIIISPDYLQVNINPADVKTLKRFFGKRNVFDFTGINEYTEDIHNYYEPGHYRPALGKRLMEKIYEPYILSPNAKSPASPSPGTI
jgi:hypothetical protein